MDAESINKSNMKLKIPHYSFYNNIKKSAKWSMRICTVAAVVFALGIKIVKDPDMGSVVKNITESVNTVSSTMNETRSAVKSMSFVLKNLDNVLSEKEDDEDKTMFNLVYDGMVNNENIHVDVLMTIDKTEKFGEPISLLSNKHARIESITTVRKRYMDDVDGLSGDNVDSVYSEHSLKKRRDGIIKLTSV